MMVRATHFLKELRRRRVFRVAALYIIGAWVLIQVADLLLEAFGVSGIALRYLFIAAVVGFPLALVFGWRYDITEEGIKRTPAASDAPVDLSLTRADYLILAAFLLVAGMIFYHVAGRVLEVPAEGSLFSVGYDPPTGSIAVLPFRNLGDSSDAFLTDGLTEELSGNLGRVPDLMVTATRSTFTFRDTTLDVREIGRRLNVRHVLDGSIRRIQDRLRVNVELIDVKNGNQVWGNAYDRDLRDIIAVQSELAASIVTALDVPGSGSPVVDEDLTDDPVAYALYLEGQQELREQQSIDTPGDFFVRAREKFKGATEADPGFAAAWAMYGRTFLYLLYAHRFDQYDASLAAARDAVQRAMDLDPAHDKPYEVLAMIREYELDFEGAIEALRRAIELNPSNAHAHADLGDLLWGSWQIAEGRALIRRALVLDPLNRQIIQRNITLTRELGDCEAAEQQFKRAGDMAGGPPQCFGHHDEALKTALDAYDPDGGDQFGAAQGKHRIAVALLNLREHELAERWLEFTGVPPDTLSTVFSVFFTRAQLAVFSGRAAENCAFLNRMIVEHLPPIGERLQPPQGDVLATAIWTCGVAGRYRLALDYFNWVRDRGRIVQIPLRFQLATFTSAAWLADKVGADELEYELLDTIGAWLQNAERGGIEGNPAVTKGHADYRLLIKDDESALDLLEQAVEYGFRGADYLRTDPRWDRLRQHPRFQSIAARIDQDLESMRSRAREKGWLRKAAELLPEPPDRASRQQ